MKINILREVGKRLLCPREGSHGLGQRRTGAFHSLTTSAVGGRSSSTEGISERKIDNMPAMTSFLPPSFELVFICFVSPFPTLLFFPLSFFPSGVFSSPLFFPCLLFPFFSISDVAYVFPLSLVLSKSRNSATTKNNEGKRHRAFLYPPPLFPDNEGFISLSDV